MCVSVMIRLKETEIVKSFNTHRWLIAVITIDRVGWRLGPRLRRLLEYFIRANWT